MSEDDRAILRKYLAGLEAGERLRALYPGGDALSEPVVDRLWEIMGRKPNAAEYLALASLFRDAAVRCERDAGVMR